MAEFSVHGPFEIPVREEPRGTLINQESLEDEFWAHNECGSRRGCYVFALRAGGGITPFYVGKTLVSFESECFQPHKTLKYIEALAHRRRRIPVMFFLCAEGPGRPNAGAIMKLEQQLIDMAVDQNGDLLNIVGTNEEQIVVHGALGPHHGRSDRSAKLFRRMMGLLDHHPASGNEENHAEAGTARVTTTPQILTDPRD